MKRVYVAGPYSSDPEANVARAMEAATELLDAGYAPYLPHLCHYWHAAHPRDYGVWMALDAAWVRVSDAVLRLPGHSPGADEEVALAAELGLPVYGAVEELIARERGEGRQASGGD
jgi:hypothetical protein